MPRLGKGCDDCKCFKYQAASYMVTNEVWTHATRGNAAVSLCLGCLTKRLGRKLTPEDFPRDVPANGRLFDVIDNVRSKKAPEG